MSKMMVSEEMKNAPAAPSPLRRLLCWEGFLLAVTLAVFIGNAVASPYFLNIWNLSDATFTFTEKAIVVLPMAMLIIAREIDLSVASTMALSSTVMGFCAAAGMDTPLLVVIGLGVGLLCGLFNGLLVTRFNLSSIVITIGTMSLYRGITYILLGDQALNHYPESFAWFGQGYVWGALSFEFALFILLAAAFTFLLHKTNFGRRTYAIGNNPTGAWFSGINVKRHNLVLFALVGLMAGLAAVLLTSRLGSTRPTLAMGWELAVVTMAVLGGVNILGGSGSMPGVIIAAFLMGLVTFGLSLLNVPGIVMSVIIDPNLIPDIAVDDASVMLDIPPAVTAATGMDALTHAIEAFVSVGAHPLTDANALEAIRLINLWLPKAVDDGHDLQAREQMAFGQYLAGMAFNSAGLGLVHALAHQPGATHNLPHGVCNAILLPIIENFNRPNAVARFARVAQAMGVDTRGMSDEAASMEAINAIRTLSKRVGIPQGFSQLGVSKADIEGWLDKALADPCAPCNPRPASRDEVRELYLEAL